MEGILYGYIRLSLALQLYKMAATTDPDLSCILPSVQDVLSAFKSSGSFDDLRQSCLEEIQVNVSYQ